MSCFGCPDPQAQTRRRAARCARVGAIQRRCPGLRHKYDCDRKHNHSQSVQSVVVDFLETVADGPRVTLPDTNPKRQRWATCAMATPLIDAIPSDHEGISLSIRSEATVAYRSSSSKKSTLLTKRFG